MWVEFGQHPSSLSRPVERFVVRRIQRGTELCHDVAMQARFVAIGVRFGALAVALVVAACSGTATSDTSGAASSASTDAAISTEGMAPPGSPSDEPLGREELTSGAATATATGIAPTCPSDVGAATTGRTDIQPSGNRQVAGSLQLLDAPVASTVLPAAPTWVVPYFRDQTDCDLESPPDWYVVLDDGRAVIVRGDGTATMAGEAPSPPETVPGTVRSAYDDLAKFDNPLPDSRVVLFAAWTATLVEPTERYGHGVLGDRIEAAAVQVINTETGSRTRISIDAPTVIEGISPMLIDVDQPNDGTPEVLVTLSNSDVGAWLALYNIDGTLRAASTPIGQGNRWRNQLGAGLTDAGFEIVDVRTPHLDGVVEFFSVVGNRFERTASISGYTNHTLGSRNLDLGVLVDADADGLVEVVLPTRDLQSLAVIDRVGDEAIERGRIDLASSLSTNIASQETGDRAWLAIGTKDGRLLVFGDAAAGVVD